MGWYLALSASIHRAEVHCGAVVRDLPVFFATPTESQPPELTPAMYAPFPFADGKPHEYRCRETFGWVLNATEHCAAAVDSALWPLGDGFVRVSAALQAGAWQVEARFETGPATERTVTWQVD